MKKVLVLASLCATNAFAQIRDTTMILREAEIRTQAKLVADIGKLSQNIAPNLLNADLGSLLQSSSQVMIKSYGPGMLASLSIRGTGASHSPILWHGMNIQNSQNSQQDLSLISAFLFDDITLSSGAQNHLSSGGILGGRLELGNSSGEKKQQILAGIDLGSFGTKCYRLGADWHYKKLQHRIRFVNQEAENNFSYRNRSQRNGPLERMPNASYAGLSLLNELTFQWSHKWSLGINSWHQKANRAIPPTLLSLSEATQYDESTRLNANLQYSDSAQHFRYSMGWFNEALNYRDIPRNIRGRNLSKRWINQLSYRRIGKIINWQAGINHQYDIGISRNYQAERNEVNDIAAYIALFGTIKRLTWKADVRQEFRNTIKQEPAASIGLEYKLNSKNDIGLHLARVSRLPGLNDLYWYPGGNQNLNPEKGMSAEINYLYHQQHSIYRYGVQFSAFYSRIQNWIIWIPSHGFWTPQNLLEVHNRGLEWETNISGNRKNRSVDLRYGGSLSFASNQKGEYLNKQLIYVPFWKNFLSLSWQTKNLIASYRHSFIGGRYTSSDNESFLPPFSSGDLELRYKIDGIQIGASIQNIWNVYYENMEWRPMPGRYFQLSLDYTFKNK